MRAEKLLASESFCIDANPVEDMGVQAAQITLQSMVPITKIHLLEVAGQRIIAHDEEEQQEMNAANEVSERHT